ncbi:MAG: GDP-mannose 4,6-dehydratase [Actinomycetota bacterium]|nr:GDP-mannose 4,6-dehydratase [Actinomycetota bacterium]
MRVLLAGGGGFIGSHLSEALVARGDEVVVVDDFSTGRRENLVRVTVQMVEHDVSEPLPDLGRFDAVLNLASPASPDDFRNRPMAILSAGSRGTWNLLDLAAAEGARFLQASTSEVYGDPLEHPQSEDYLGNVDPIGPRSCYDEAKRFGEALVVAHSREHGTDVGIARIFNTYGERMAPGDGRVVNTFIAQALAGRSLTVFGDGAQTRSFCHVSDQVAGLQAVLDYDGRGPFNIGNPDEHTIRELAERIIALTGSASEIVNVELPAERIGDPARRRPDITRAREVLGWEPAVDLEEGLLGMIEHFRTSEHLG